MIHRRLLKGYSGSRDPRLPAWVPRACARSDNVATLMLGVAQWFPRHLSRRRRTTDDEA